MKSLKLPQIALLVIVGAVSCPAWSGVGRDDVDPSIYLTLGADPNYASVGFIETATRGNKGYYGSGTLIAPNWVLTAGHMVDRVTSLTYSINGSSYTADTWEAYPSWNGNLSSGYDIALVHLVNAVSDVTPAWLYEGTDELNRVGTFVGYGTTGNGLTGETTFDMQKRAGQNVVDSSMGSGRILLADFDNPQNPNDSHYGSSAPLDWEYLIGSGDSGGGLFIDFGTGPQLVGVHSFAQAWDGNVNSDYGDACGATRVSSYLDWIAGYTAYNVPQLTILGDFNGDHAVDIADYTTWADHFGGADSVFALGSSNGDGAIDIADYTTWADHFGNTFAGPGVPEPATLSLLALGGAALLRRRRG